MKQIFRDSIMSITRLASVLVFFAHNSSFSAPAALECPPSIPKQSVQLVATPSGWVTYVGRPLYLHAAAPMSSPPAELGELVPDAERRIKTGVMYTYKLDGDFPSGKWLACKYGESNMVTLARPLPADTNECTVEYHKGVHFGQNVIKVTCK